MDNLLRRSPRSSLESEILMFTVKNYRLGAACARACRIRSLIRQCRAGFVHLWLIVMLAMSVWPPGAQAQVPAPGVDSQFDIIGFIQEATLDSCIATDAFCGGQIKVNGQTIIVPRNLIVILPANALTWAELFSQSPLPYTGKATGMALADVPLPLTTYEVHVTGNQVNDVFTAGLIDIAQQSVNAGAGFINYIDYTKGEMRVGGQVIRVAGLPENLLSTSNPGARVRLNDPKGGFGRAMTVDSRMTLDPDNPTVRSKTGFPMCVPRTDPKISDDPACPQRNRPRDPPLTGPFSTKFMMNLPITTGQDLDPRLMAPFEVGDYVSYAGTLASDAGGISTSPFPNAASTFISAHTVTGNLAISTQPGSNPAYVAIDTSLIGNGGVIEPANLEATVRTRFEGFTTDPTRDIQLFAIDYSPVDGSATDRLWGIVGVDPGPPNGAVKGRWRFRPPCTGVTATFRFCFGPLDETTFLPAPREVRAAVGGTWVTPRTTKELNGLIAGQYHAPIAAYLFAENLAGTTPPPINFGSLPFLANGGYSSSVGVVPAGRLSPFPGSAPIVACTPPTASAGSNFSVASGTKGVVLNGTATGSGTLAYLWTPPVAITLTPSATVLTPTFDAPVFTTASTGNTYPFTLKVSGCNGLTAISTVTVSVTAPITAAPPVVNAIASQTVNSGKTVSLTAVASGGSAPLKYNWTQSSGVPQPFSLSATDPAAIQVTHSLASNQVTNDVLVYTVVVSDSTNAVSAPIPATITYTPVPDVETMTLATYIISKQKLTLSVTSSVINPALMLKLLPYATTGGATFDPSTTGNTFVTNGTNGVYNLTLSGVPEPAASVTVKSSIGGTTTFLLTKVR